MTQRFTAVWALAICGFAAGCTAVAVATHTTSQDPMDAPAGTYTLNPRHTSLLFKVGHLGFTEFVGRFNDVSGTLEFVPAAPELSTLTVGVTAASVATVDEAFDRLIREEAFEAGRYPNISFAATRLVRTGPATGTMTGDLTFHGTKRPVTLNVTLHGAGTDPLLPEYILGFDADGELKRSAFGASAWIPAVGDTVHLEIHAEFTQPRHSRKLCRGATPPLLSRHEKDRSGHQAFQAG